MNLTEKVIALAMQVGIDIGNLKKTNGNIEELLSNLSSSGGVLENIKNGVGDPNVSTSSVKVKSGTDTITNLTTVSEIKVDNRSTIINRHIDGTIKSITKTGG